VHVGGEETGFILPPGELTVSFIFEEWSNPVRDFFEFNFLGGSLEGEDVYTGETKILKDIISPFAVTIRYPFENDKSHIFSEESLPSDFTFKILHGIESLYPSNPTDNYLMLSFSLGCIHYTTGMFVTDLKLDFKTENIGLKSINILDRYSLKLGTSGLHQKLTLAVPSSGLLSDITIRPVSPPDYVHAIVRSIPLSATAEIFNPEGESIGTFDLDYSKCKFESGDISSQSITVSDTPFDQRDSPGGSPLPQYEMQITSNKKCYIGYIWKYRDGGDQVCYADTDKWTVDSTLGIRRSATQTYPSDIGQMLPIDLDNFQPLCAIDSNKLKSLDRKFIDYAGYGDEYTSLANPITFQADSYGGGIVSYGISTSIGPEHVMSNSSISGVVMQMIASHNCMNLWSIASSKQSVVNVSMGVKRWDKLDVILQEGLTEEWNDNSGSFDTWVAASYEDYNGADWYTTEQYPGTPENMEVTFFNQTLKLRQPSQEMTSWDNEMKGFDVLEYPAIRYPQIAARYVEFDINTTDLDFDTYDKYYLEVQLTFRSSNMKAGYTPPVIWKNLTIDENTKSVRFELQEFSEIEETIVTTHTVPYSGSEFWYAPSTYTTEETRVRTVCTTSHMIFDGSSDEGVKTPLLVTAIYKENPRTLRHADPVAAMSNLVYFDYMFPKLAIDKDYAAVYEEKWNQIAANRAYMKPILFTTGVAMVIGGTLISIYGAGSCLPLIVFGLDMCLTQAYEVSFIERGLSKLAKLAFIYIGRKNTTYLNTEQGRRAFSFYQLTSNRLVNLMVIQATFFMLSAGLSGAAAFKAAWARTSILETGKLVARATVIAGVAARLAFQIAIGTMFMVLDAIRGTWTDGGVLAELLIQAAIIASLVIKVRRALKGEGNFRWQGDQLVEEGTGPRPWWRTHIIDTLMELYEHIKKYGWKIALKMTNTLDFACDCFEVGISVLGMTI
jgi:hypothetical protein